MWHSQGSLPKNRFLDGGVSQSNLNPFCCFNISSSNSKSPISPIFTCGCRPTSHRVIPVVVVVVVVGVGAETTFKPMYDVWVSSEKPLFFPKPIYDFGGLANKWRLERLPQNRRRGGRVNNGERVKEDRVITRVRSKETCWSGWYQWGLGVKRLVWQQGMVTFWTYSDIFFAFLFHTLDKQTIRKVWPSLQMLKILDKITSPRKLRQYFFQGRQVLSWIAKVDWKKVVQEYRVHKKWYQQLLGTYQVPCSINPHTLCLSSCSNEVTNCGNVFLKKYFDN